jgi:hypothetical protein
MRFSLGFWEGRDLGGLVTGVQRRAEHVQHECVVVAEVQLVSLVPVALRSATGEPCSAPATAPTARAVCRVETAASREQAGAPSLAQQTVVFLCES